MNRRFVVLIFAALVSIPTGCNDAKKATSISTFSSSQLVMAYAASPQRYIAERHKLEIITPESDLQKSWESTVAYCGTIQCEVVSSSITTRAGDSMPSGIISLRVAPDDLKRLLGSVVLGKIVQHTTEREDKTIVVVDTEAKIKNLTSFRDNLRTMLSKPAATVKDLVEIQKQLTDTQSELDSETAQRKILANETEKIAVEISFRVERPSRNAGGFAQIRDALRESGSILGDSTASLITTIVAIIPWLVLIVPAVWLLAKVWRKLKLRRNRPVLPPTSRAAS
jgi:hypothetical protein